MDAKNGRSFIGSRSSNNQQTHSGSAPGWTRDVLASIVVFLVALPLCMGIAIASGVPPAMGLVTGIVGGLVVGFLAGSPLQVNGPAAGLAIIVFDLVQNRGVAFLGPVLVVAGLIQLAAGLLRMGQYFRAMSPAVIYGMLAGIGILIMGAQFHVMLGEKPKPHGLENLLGIPEALHSVFSSDGSNSAWSALIGVTTIAMLVLWEKMRPARARFVPGALLGVVVASFLAVMLRLPIQYIDLPANFLRSIQLPDPVNISLLFDPSLLSTAVALAVIASAETLLSAAAVDQMHAGSRTNYNKELVAQGIGNSICGLLGGLPMTGVIVRSSANVQAGAVSRLSAILHGAWILLFVLFLPHILKMVPVASLAGVLVYTGYKLMNPSYIKTLAAYGRMPLVIFAVTVVIIVSTDLLMGVLTGLALSVLKLLYKATHLKVTLNASEEQRRADVHLEGAATFMRLPQLAATLEKVPHDMHLQIHVDRLYYIDHTCLHLLRSTASLRESQGSRLEIAWEVIDARYRRMAVAS